METPLSENSNVSRLPGSEATAEAAYRAPPHNYEAEQALLGAILTNNRAYEKVSEFLLPEHFADPVHGRIYAAAGKLIEQARLADALTLKTLFDQDNALAEIGGAQYLARLSGSVVTVINAEDYGRTIHDMFLRRELVQLGTDVVNDAYAGDIDNPAPQQIETAEQKLYDLATEGSYEGGFQSLEQATVGAIQMAEAAFKKDSHVTGVATGLKDLDLKLGGLQPSDLLIVAARPGMGKTSLATNIAYNAARAKQADEGEDGAMVGFFSLEMSAEQLATRILSERSEVSSDKIRRGEINQDQFERLVMASQELARLPLFIDDTPALTVSGLRTRARRLKRQHGLGLLVVDYLQLLQGSPTARNENRVQEISEISRGLKTLAKELEVPVLALSQLSRAVESRDDKRPQLSDLRESGSIEQDADVVMFIFREQYYLEKQEPVQRADENDEKYVQRVARWQQRCDEMYNIAEILISKQRHGPTGSVKLFFDGTFTRFGDLERQHSPDVGY